MQRLAIRIGCRSTRFEVFSFCFVHDEKVGHFDDPSFDALHVVTCATNQHQHKDVNHAPHGHFALTNSDSFDKDQIVSRGFTELNRF